MQTHIWAKIGALSTLMAALGWLAACGGSGPKLVPTGGQVTTTMSDPATCSSATGGPFSHVYVTVADVEATLDSSGSSGWQDLTPNLKTSPMQIDLLSQANTQCLLATLGDVKQLPPGNYSMIRLLLEPNSSASLVTNNACGSSAANCVVLAANNSVQPLQLSSEAQTGIKIPTSQISGGQLTVANGKAVDLDIDFNSCASIVTEGNGQYRLKPVLHAGEISTNSTSIQGTVTDSATQQPITPGSIVVALEQPDSNGIDRVVMQTLADSNGNFVFCPLAPGNYDVVVDAMSKLGVTYAATVTRGVPAGTSMGNIPLIAEPVASGQAPATIQGQVSSTGSSGAQAISVAISALQPVTLNGSTVQVSIPLPQQSTVTTTLDTASGSGCPSGTDCASYSLVVPAANPNVGQFSSGGTTYTQSSAAAAYTVDGQATEQDTTIATCTTSDLQTSSLSSGGALDVTSGSTVTASTLAFQSCSPTS